MPGSKEIRTKIKSVQNTRKITKAMEMVAASKMRKAQERMRASRPYLERVFDIERWETPAYGGHFPALEATDVLADSLRRFTSR